MPEVFFAIFEKKEAAVIHTRSGISGWSVIAIIPKEELVSHITPLRYIFAIIILFMIFMVAVSYSFMNSVITRPIENIISMMKKIETGNFDTIIRENSNIETGLLSSK
jgi:two-component system sensor histidine kinase YesM